MTWPSQAVEINGIKVLAARMEGADNKVLRETLDQLKNKLGSAAVVLGAVNGDKVTLVAGVTKDQTGTIKAGELVNQVATQVGGKGGGRPDMAQAGGNQPETERLVGPSGCAAIVDLSAALIPRPRRSEGMIYL